MKTPRFLLPAATAGVLALTLTACGGGGGGGTAGGGSDAEANLEGRGPITYVQGKDNSNVVRPLLDKWNAAHPDEQVTFKEQECNKPIILALVSVFYNWPVLESCS
jgi:multiple sugar transport system substrate-binding protein